MIRVPAIRLPTRRWIAAVAVAGSLAAMALTAVVAPEWLSEARAQWSYRSTLAATSAGERRASLQRTLRLMPAHRQARLQLAEDELGAGRYEAAFLQFLVLREAHPERPDGWFGLARIRAAAKQPREAAAAAERAIESAADAAAPHRLRAEMCLQLRRYRCASVEGLALSRLRPADAAGWIALAEATLALDGREAAGRELERGLAAGAEPEPLRRMLADTRGRSEGDAAPLPDAGQVAATLVEQWPGQLGEQLHEFTQRLERQDWPGASRVAKAAAGAWGETFVADWLEGIVELAQGRFDAAERHFTAALSAAPGSHRVMTNLATVWSKRDGPRAAGQKLVGLAERDAGAGYALPIAAHAFLEASEPALAETALRKGIVLRPQSARAYRDLAEFQLELDQPDAALATVRAASAKFPHNLRLQLLGAQANRLLGDRQAAIDAYEQALAVRPDLNEATASLAMLVAEGHPDETARSRAMSLVRRLQRNAPEEPIAMDAIGWLRFSLGGEAGEGERWLRAARDASPDDPEIRFHLASVLAASGRARDAADELHHSLSSGQTFASESRARELLARVDKAIARKEESPR